MAKLKVVEVIRQGQIRGGNSHLLDLIYFLNKEKVNPICLSFSDGEMIRRLPQMGIDCRVINTQKPFDIRVQGQVIKLIKDEQIQLMSAHGSRTTSNMIYPVRKLHLPLVYMVHGWSFHDDQSFFVKKIRGLSEILIFHYKNQVICVSESNKNKGKEVIEYQTNGIVVPFNVKSALADSICHFYNNSSQMRKCSESARRYVSEHFNAKRVADSVMLIYSKLLI